MYRGLSNQLDGGGDNSGIAVSAISNLSTTHDLPRCVVRKTDQLLLHFGSFACTFAQLRQFSFTVLAALGHSEIDLA
jgi:hypothetical protein